MLREPSLSIVPVGVLTPEIWETSLVQRLMKQGWRRTGRAGSDELRRLFGEFGSGARQALETFRTKFKTGSAKVTSEEEVSIEREIVRIGHACELIRLATAWVTGARAEPGMHGILENLRRIDRGEPVSPPAPVPFPSELTQFVTTVEPFRSATIETFWPTDVLDGLCFHVSQVTVGNVEAFGTWELTIAPLAISTSVQRGPAGEVSIDT